MENYDFSGWATKANLRCSDGRIIMKDAFKHYDGKKVPLCWGHQHDDPLRVLGHAILENREDGVYAYCKLNNTEQGKTAKELVEHGDVAALSIFANQLEQQGPNVLHGEIREVSLVLAGANPGASIDAVIKHSDDGDTYVDDSEGILYTGEDEIYLSHSDFEEDDEDDEDEIDEDVDEEDTELSHADNDDKSIMDIFNEMTDDQQIAVCAIVEQVLENANKTKENKETKNETKESEGGDTTMKHNVFDKSEKQTGTVLSHDAMKAIINDAKRYGSMKESFLQHSQTLAHSTDTEEGKPFVDPITQANQTYGIIGTDFLYPEAKNLNVPPEFIKRDMGWVTKVINGVHHTPFSRIKSMFADITEEDARAKGYIKGSKKKDEVFALLKRTTTPTTIYKKQKMDRDDVVDITDFDVIAWIKAEMRMMLDEEKARAILIGDGRSASSDDKINEQNIRPIYKDEDLYSVPVNVTEICKVTAADEDDKKAKAFIKSVIKSRKNYKGSGEPTLYTTEDVLTDCLLIEDSTGRVIYDSIEKLKNALRVKDIVTVPVMENVTREVDGKKKALMGIVVNLKDYNVGADKGGAVNMFDDFDIDYNQQKYLIETRCSGALTKPHSALVIEIEEAAA